MPVTKIAAELGVGERFRWNSGEYKVVRQDDDNTIVRRIVDNVLSDRRENFNPYAKVEVL